MLRAARPSAMPNVCHTHHAGVTSTARRTAHAPSARNAAAPKEYGARVARARALMEKPTVERGYVSVQQPCREDLGRASNLGVPDDHRRIGLVENDLGAARLADRGRAQTGHVDRWRPGCSAIGRA